MPKLITNANERQAHPIYPNVRTKNHHMTDKQHAEMSEKTTATPKTYDAIKSAAGADVRPKGAPRR